MTTREVRLASRPAGTPAAANFAFAEVDLPPLADGQVLVRNRFISVDPYMRGRMSDAKSYVPPYPIGAALEGGAIGEVLESRAPDLQPGVIVRSNLGWREHFVADAREVRAVRNPIEPLSVHLGVLGMTGFTAWVGLSLVDLKAGERVFVSAAAGAVGSVAGQLAKLRGCFVVGSAGSDEKVRLVTDEFGFDAAFNYKRGDVSRQLPAAAPEGIDVYFDNVGGDHLEAALSAMRVNGRIAVCGMISRYNTETPPPAPRNLILIVGKRVTIRGFLVLDWNHRMPEFFAEVGPAVAAGRLKWRETVVRGLDRAPDAFISLFHGDNIGKLVVALD